MIKLSIIIPALNEAEKLQQLLQNLEGLVPRKEEVEIIISDGGSTDQTFKVTANLAVKVVESPGKGRALQMNFGADQAKGEILYFLHADTLPPENFVWKIRQALSTGFDAGCFRLRFDRSHPGLNFFCWFTRFDIDLFRFGDQSLFVRRSVFEKTGGFDEKMLVMEDQEIVKRIKQKASFAVLPDEVITSARKYNKIGVFKLQLIFTIIVALYYIGVRQNVIAHFYKNNLTGFED